MSTAAALIIGDEILTGKIRDENTHTLSKLLFEQGVDLERVVTIPDDIPTISTELRGLCAGYDYVFTSGGIGPTHDDKTYEAVAQSFNRPLKLHSEALGKLETHMRTYYPELHMTEARKRMAYLPEPCEIIWTPNMWVPLVVVENVYILPGIPMLFTTMLHGARDRFRGTPKHRIQIYTMLGEGDIAQALHQTQHKFPEVAIGSYPRTSEVKYQVMVSLEGRDRIQVERAAEEVERATKGYR